MTLTRPCIYCLDRDCQERNECHLIMKGCMQSHNYGENTGKGFTGRKISDCRECMARMACDKVSWVALGGNP